MKPLPILALGIFCLSPIGHAGLVEAVVARIVESVDGKKEPVSAPIKIEPGTRTTADLKKSRSAWLRRAVVQPALDRLSGRNEPWVADARQFLDDAVAWNAIWLEESVPADLDQRARRLVEAGCDDPAVLLFAAEVDRAARSDWSWQYDRLEKALSGWQTDPQTPSAVIFITQRSLATAFKSGGHSRISLQKHDGPALEALRKMGTDGSYKPDEMDLLMIELCRSDSFIERNAAEVRDLSPKLEFPGWIRLTLLGFAETKLAWDARGNGYGNTVSDEGWLGFKKHLALAREALVEAWKINPKNPAAATGMLPVVMGGDTGSGETGRLWFDRATAAVCDYGPAYNSILWFSRPRWGGSHQQMLAFGQACLDTGRFDLEIPAVFVRACNEIAGELPDWHEFYRRPEVAKPLIAASIGLAEEPARNAERPMRLSDLAINAWLTGDFLLAAGTLKKLDAPLHPGTTEKLLTHHISESELRGDTAINTTAFAKEYNRARELLGAGQYAEAEKTLQKIVPELSGPGVPWANDLLAFAVTGRQLATGEWVNLPTTPGLPGWLVTKGEWAGESDGTLLGRGTDTKASIIHRAPVGPDFEMRAEVSIGAKDNCCHQCGMIYGWRSGIGDEFTCAAIEQWGKGPIRATLLRSYWSAGEIAKKLALNPVNQLHLTANLGRVTFQINGKAVIEDYQPLKVNFGPADGRVGFAAGKLCLGNTLRIRNIQVRRLK